MVLVGVAGLGFAALVALDITGQYAALLGLIAVGPILGAAIGRVRAAKGMEDSQTILGAMLGGLGESVLGMVANGIHLHLGNGIRIGWPEVANALSFSFLAMSFGTIVGLVMCWVFRLAGWPTRRGRLAEGDGVVTGQEGLGVVESEASGVDTISKAPSP
jgi:hypothetical protein